MRPRRGLNEGSAYRLRMLGPSSVRCPMLEIANREIQSQPRLSEPSKASWKADGDPPTTYPTGMARSSRIIKHRASIVKPKVKVNAGSAARQQNSIAPELAVINGRQPTVPIRSIEQSSLAYTCVCFIQIHSASPWAV